MSLFELAEGENPGIELLAVSEGVHIFRTDATAVAWGDVQKENAVPLYGDVGVLTGSSDARQLAGSFETTSALTFVMQTPVAGYLLLPYGAEHTLLRIGYVVPQTFALALQPEGTGPGINPIPA